MVKDNFDSMGWGEGARGRKRECENCARLAVSIHGNAMAQTRQEKVSCCVLGSRIIMTADVTETCWRQIFSAGRRG